MIVAEQPKVKPTAKQRRAAANYVANGGNVSKAMVDAGYSPQTAKSPQKLSTTEGFRLAMEEAGITDKRIADVMNEGLGATKAVVMGTKSDESFVDIQPDFGIRHKYMETAIKVAGFVKELDQPAGTTYNTYIQQNNLNPNAPEAKALVDSTLETLMEQMKRGQGTA